MQRTTWRRSTSRARTATAVSSEKSCGFPATSGAASRGPTVPSTAATSAGVSSSTIDPAAAPGAARSVVMTATGLKTWNGWVMTAPAEPLQHRTGALLEPGPGEAVVAVAGCGVCHTDLAFLYQGVKTRHPPPLVLGHEISGMVAATGAGVATDLVGKRVLVPAVLPCGDCELCRAGRRTICRGQVMPGNDRDGGFASHLVVPARFLCPVPERVLDTHELWELAVVSDAVSTPFQAVRRSGLRPGELAVFIGIGGVGVHGVQIAAASGGTVLALDLDDPKLEQARQAGARATLNIAGIPLKEIRKLVKDQP